MKSLEILNTCYEKILYQGKPSFLGFDCAYRGAGGTKCPVGMLLTDDEYSAEMEGKTPYVLELPKRLSRNVDLLTALQVAHDDAANAWNEFDCNKADFIEIWTASCIEVARKFKLSTFGIKVALIEYNNRQRRNKKKLVPTFEAVRESMKG